MADQLSGIAIIICIALGSLTALLLFLFGKRQIMRFALKSRSGPHVSVGSGANRSLISEIRRRLSVINKIQCEPQLLTEENEQLFVDYCNCQNLSPPHLYRMKVVQELKNLELLIYKFHKRRKSPLEDEFVFFKKMQQEEVFKNLEMSVLENLLHIYEHARYEPQEFLYNDYKTFNELLLCVKTSLCKAGSSHNERDQEKTMSVSEKSLLLTKKSVSFDVTSDKANFYVSPAETPV